MLVPLVLACGCVTSASRAYRANEEPKIREEVLLEHLALRDTNRVVFLAFFDSVNKQIDPSDKFLQRVHALGIPARKASQAARDDQTRVVDRTTGELGVIYYAGVHRWLSNSSVEVTQGVTCASLGGGFSEFIMKKKDGKWTRTKTKRVVTI
jgi:hypothetical protein